MSTVALIVTYNRLDKLKLCWAETARQSFDYIVIVNNASTDSTAEWLETIIDNRLHIVTSTINTGGSGGFKQGSCYISKNIAASWVFIYDDDAYPQVNIVNNFKNIANINSYDAYACKVIDTKGTVCKMNLPWVRYPKSLKENFKYFRDPADFIVDTSRRENIISFSFVGLIISADLLKKTTEHIHEELFLYFDDIYYSTHLHNLGYKLCYNPDLVFTHDIPPHHKNIVPPWKVYYLIRNMLLDKKIFSSLSPFTFTFKISRLIKYAAVSFHQPHFSKYLSYYFKGVLDGLRGIMGRKH